MADMRIFVKTNYMFIAIKWAKIKYLIAFYRAKFESCYALSHGAIDPESATGT
ncbi:hypothetical protein [Sphingobium sp.]|uniref:hypothetical protein n=1 Tax=Sphingobium sp. TaxID=1912891 RepID=UPI0028BD1666|nr:hypothetical protein [Sphingobium sp.]